ncbi:hypothetical protein ABT256_15200 [Amycolatopsis japonica]|uniref:hypothetical protein n=1 Tax=Amycolatopsis japonica TaxID=208439 RepID=UPI00333272B7
MPLHRRWSEEAIPAEQRQSWPVLFQEQHGIVTRAQLLAYGHSRAAIVANLEAGRWQRVLPRVYATFTGLLPRQARIHAALRYGGGHAVLSHRTAAEAWPPRTKPTDTIVDLAVPQAGARDAVNVVVDLVSRSEVPVSAMRDCVSSRPPFRFRAEIQRGLELVAGGLMSALEVEFKEQVEERHGLPPGDRQTAVKVDGKTLWEDVTYDSRGAALTVRLDGRATHAMAAVAFRDRRRDNAAELTGRARLVYGWRDVRNSPCQVAAEVRTVLMREGWRPTAERVTCDRTAAPRSRPGAKAPFAASDSVKGAFSPHHSASAY